MSNIPLVRLPPWYPGQMGVPGSDNSLGLRTAPTAKVLYVDYNHPDASDDHDGTNPDHPLSTVQEAVDKLENNFDVIRVRSINSSGDSVVTPDYATGPSYVTIEGVGPSRYGVYWQSEAADEIALDMRAVGWVVRGFRFGGQASAACIELRHTDSGANDIAIRTIIEDCYFDGLTTGLAGIITHGCYDVWIKDCTFSLWHNAGGTAAAINIGTTPLAIPYRQHIVGCHFYDNDNHVICPMNGSFVRGCTFQQVGYTYTATASLQTTLGGNPGDDNVISGNVLTGDYSIAGGYAGGAADIWIGNMADDTAEAEVGDNGFTLLPPA